MEKIRKGKDIAVTWKVTTNGQDISLVGQDLILKVWGANARPMVLDFDIIEPNTLSFVWHGESQSNSGEYYLSLFRANSPKSIVDTPFVQLVNRSWEEEGAVRSDLQTETVELESGNFSYNVDYNQLVNKPTINGVDFVGNINLYNKSEMDELLTGKQGVIVGLETIRSNAGEGHTAYGWGNHALRGYITKSVSDLANYYIKSETYTKAEVLALIDAIKQFSYKVVATLPTASASTMHKIYLVPSTESKEQNIKDEFITILDGSTYKWEQIGSTTIDLSDYPTFEQMTTAINTALVGYATNTDLSTAFSNEVSRADEKYATQTEVQQIKQPQYIVENEDLQLNII